MGNEETGFFGKWKPDLCIVSIQAASVHPPKTRVVSCHRGIARQEFAVLCAQYCPAHGRVYISDLLAERHHRVNSCVRHSLRLYPSVFESVAKLVCGHRRIDLALLSKLLKNPLEISRGVRASMHH